MAKCEEMIMESLLPFSSEDDGIIFVDEVDNNGNMKGRHRVGGQDKEMTGKCKANEKKFECEREDFKYAGRIFAFEDDSIQIVVGMRSPKAEKRKKEGEEVDGDEVWVGVKTST